MVWQKEEMIYLAVLEWVKNSWVQFFTQFLSKETFIPYIYIYIKIITEKILVGIFFFSEDGQFLL